MFKKIINNILFTTTTFSRIPVKKVPYSKENTEYLYLVLPLVGLIYGIILFASAYGITKFVNNNVISSLMIIGISLFVSGGIHVDGFLDTTDAFKSYRERAQKAEILKDSLLGAFALIHFTILIIMMICVYYFIFQFNAIYLFLVFPILSRTLALILIVKNEILPGDMLRDMLSDIAKKYGIIASVIYMILVALISYYFASTTGLIITIIMIITGLIYLKYFTWQYKIHLDYLSGDLCGHTICMLEALLPASAIIFMLMNNM
ncbi:adenosylcobinamide-GDP ribazoletransferase [Mycoplasma sp. P36-A1]|uniref:adenosylcobinamide-GDP ribazoletransferase n=1 Tax=Mycoplasma sp. P36-A1 TaxID=3252900 RepID=UPI003C2AB519